MTFRADRKKSDQFVSVIAVLSACLLAVLLAFYELHDTHCRFAGPDGTLRMDSMDTSTVADSVLDSADFDDALDDDIDEDEEAEAEAQAAEGKSPLAKPESIPYENGTPHSHVPDSGQGSISVQ